MGSYAVYLNGRNFLVQRDGSLEKLGFYVTSYVEADDPEGAEAAAVTLLQDDEQLNAVVRNDAGDPPRLFVAEIRELDGGHEADGDRTGFAWYSKEDSRAK